jgi:ATP-dependent helicase/nuclease subunit A
MKLLKEQIIASSPQNNVWLSANAGTGKTHVLVNRYLRLLLDENDPNRIVCITYTKAAAAEMQTRIINKISDFIILDDESFLNQIENQFETKLEHKKLNNIRKKLAGILDNPEKLKIQTIHSFCQTILKSFPLEAQIPPFFNLIDDISKDQLIEASWQKILDNNENTWWA